jgi:nucleoside-diphosphate-sugar epimerase
MRVLVTGASGFLGHSVCQALRASNHDTIALVRRPGSEPPNTQPAHADLGDPDPTTLSTALEQAKPDAVIHLAAEIATQRSEERINNVNVDGTRRLISACKNLDTPPKLIFASTVVTGDAQGNVLTEDSTLPVQTAYGRSKQDGERLVKRSGLPYVIIRPSHVYGPGGWYAGEIVKRLRQPGRLAVIGNGRNWWDVVHVDDVAAAVVAAAERAPQGSTYHVVDDEPILQYDFVALTAKALKRGPPRKVPAAVARLVAGKGPIDAVVRSAKSSNEKLKAELGWKPRYPTAKEGVPATIAELNAS